MNATEYVSEAEKRAADRRAAWVVLGSTTVLWAVAVLLVMVS
jgi:hypothetical protein